MIVSDSNHKRPFAHDPSSSSNKKPRTTFAASVVLKHFDVPLFSITDDGAVSPCDSMRLHADQPYSIGRRPRDCEFVFRDRRVSKRHCQILFDGSLRKLYILSGVLLRSDSTANIRLVHEFRKRVIASRGSEIAPIREASNGVFVNGVEIRKGMTVELSAGDRVSLVCRNQNGLCDVKNRVGFVVQRIVLEGCDSDDDVDVEIDELTFSGHSQSGKRSKRVFAIKADVPRCEGVFGRARFLLDRCRDILLSDDPVSCIMRVVSDLQCGFKCANGNSINNMDSGNTVKLLVDGEVQELPQRVMENTSTGVVQTSSAILCESKVMDLEAKSDHFCGEGNVGVACVKAIADMNSNVVLLDTVRKDNLPSDGNKQEKREGTFHPPPGKNFYLNRLEFMNHGTSGLHHSISLPELIHPVESVSRMFIATFTSDLKWFLTYCKIPFHLPVTIACHNNERCWSSRPDERVFVPYQDYPNLVVVYPPFPETIAFGNNRKKQGIACHHPKLIILQREDSIRVVITSANLVEKQIELFIWTSNVWWPIALTVDFASLFPKFDDGDIHGDSKCDFAAQLAGFMASLVIDVPSQAHWISQLTKYDFGGATGHLVASVPGIHFYRTSVLLESFQASSLGWNVKVMLVGDPSFRANSSTNVTLVFGGLVVASVVGLSHLFCTAADSNGARLKALAAFLRKSCKNAYGSLEVVLRRNPNVPADENAVSILIPNPDQTYEGDYVQLGFLPRNVAKWVSPLWDAGFFAFSGYVCPKEALAAAVGENIKKVQLILNVSEGHHFQDMSKMMQSEQIVAFCSLIASIQRCYGLWRMQEVLNRYRWPESLQSEIIYGASSIGSINSKFLAAFSAAAGKKSLQHFDSEESDPEWGCWNAKEELENPSVRIIFPTIERVKNAHSGILPSRRILCFSERTWQRLKTLDVLHDAIPHPHERIGHPMHTKELVTVCIHYAIRMKSLMLRKVVRRCFWSRRDAPSIGWVYCGSHNFSAAAWGRQISNPFGAKPDGPQKGDPSVNSGLHICNYELGIIFTFPPTENNDCPKVKNTKLDDIILPFVVPAPKYGSRDRPATKQAMREAMDELAEQEEKQAEEEMMEELLEEEEEMEATSYVGEEKEEEKAYAEILWSQVDSSQSSSTSARSNTGSRKL
ncbi:Tyrosyl-DNA phosphodiesterase I [Sesbania bispinosa]|nr:Tyrosyl-DNA phosphodiesterase I [Sesbania bispinosa]